MVEPIWAKERTSVSRSVVNPFARPLTPAGWAAARLEATAVTVCAGTPAATEVRLRSAQRTLGRRYTCAKPMGCPPFVGDQR